MAKDKVHVAILLDRSGSMMANKLETIDAFNQYVTKMQAKYKGRFTVTQFDSQGIDTPQANVKLKEAKLLTETSYQPRGGTPLLDAIGKTVNAMDTEGYDNVVFVILTDGHENASQEYTRADIKALLEERDRRGWQVVYLGANQDAFAEGAKIGIDQGKTINYTGVHVQSAAKGLFAGTQRYMSRADKLDTSDADFTNEEREEALRGEASSSDSAQAS